MNVLPLPQTLKSAFMPKKESTHRRQSNVETKGKGREIQVEWAEDEGRPSNRVWLRSDTPYKGPNKWFGGGRLQNRDSLASQAITRGHNTDQNILFGIATLQLPVWATDSPSNPKPSKPL